MPRYHVWPLLLLGLSATVCAEDTAEVDYNFAIRPILSDRCYNCHGPDAEQRQAGLRLDEESSAKEEADSGAVAISPFQPESSELLHRVTSDDPDVMMPPPDSKLPRVTAAEVEALRGWIRQGAKWKQHWSFLPITRPPVPEVSATERTRNAIDRFVLAQLERRGMTFGNEASRERLIRRVTFDLTGLPPTTLEVQDFLNDRSDNAYEKVVDRLLNRVSYGERMASFWLDVARYADSFGYQVDRERRVWPWRDWVINAWNQNLPFDDFIVWQLAGDLLSDPTDEQILATTFNRLHSQKVEGGSTEAEFRTEYVADRTHTFATAFLGLTMECARCHDHKYDPISQKEYYQLFAFFNNIDESGLYSYFTRSVPTPTLFLSSEDEKGRIQEFERQVSTLRQQQRQRDSECRSEFESWLRSQPELPSIGGQVAHFTFDAMVEGKLANERDKEKPASSSASNVVVDGKLGRAVRLTGDDAISTSVGDFHRSHPFSYALWINTPESKPRAIILHRSQAWTDSGSRGYQLLMEDGYLSASLIHFWPGNAIRVRTLKPIPNDQWLHVAVTYDGSSRADGITMYLDGEPIETEIVRDHLRKTIQGGGGPHISLGARFRDRGFKQGLVDDLQVFNRELTAVEVGHIVGDGHLERLLKAKPQELSSADRDRLRAYYLHQVDTQYGKILETLRQTRLKRDQLLDGIQEIMVMRDMPHRRTTHVLHRGAYDAPRDPVDPDAPSVLPPIAASESRDRLGLARWLVDRQHPLTARVAVNRFWQLFLSRGLVATQEDFGSQGALPTHPRLLDWLAAEFMHSSWDTKRLVRLIVTSATYRQSSDTRDDIRARDPDNKWYSRSPRHRLPAEMIRDNVLAASGLLVSGLGGAPAKPYEVSVSFKPMGHDKGRGLYRRSLYTFWKRTGPAPVMMALDAAKRDVCSVRRERTSTPLQAIVLLNDPQFIEASRELAQTYVSTMETPRTLVASMFQHVIGRTAEDAETQILEAMFSEQRVYFLENPQAAADFLQVGNRPPPVTEDPAGLAAATVVAEAIFNLEECVTKR